jgi:hypothetical protein
MIVTVMICVEDFLFSQPKRVDSLYTMSCPETSDLETIAKNNRLCAIKETRFAFAMGESPH